MNKSNIINNQDPTHKIGIVQVINLSAEKHGARTWQTRVYEALFHIGYKQLLYDLGIDDEEAERKFQVGMQLKSLRKLLFNLCQELEMNDQARLIQLFQVCHRSSQNYSFSFLIFLGQTWPIWAESSTSLYAGEPVPASDAEPIRAHLFVCEGLSSAHAEG